MRDVISSGAPARLRALAVAALAGLVALCALVAAPGADANGKGKKSKGVPVKAMTRNIFLGADLGPALVSTGYESFIEANGEITREVDETNFPVRAKGLAAEIKQKKPDLIGLQEVALWRSGPTALPPTVVDPENPVFGATTVEYDFLALLQSELQALGMDYDVAVEKVEFDFEAPADSNNVDDDAPPGLFNPDPGVNNEAPGSLDDAEENGRLTMRDVILVRDRKGLKVKNPTSGTYSNLYTPNVAGIDIPVTRGWTAVDATVTKGKGKKRQKAKFDFVNTHFEAFDDETQVPSIRAQQATELANTAASGSKVVLVGDLNSNVPGVQAGDEQALQALFDAGFSRRSTETPASCCVPSVVSGPASEFDHVVDHVLSNSNKVKELSSSVTGLDPVNGYFDSDHAGVFSKLKIK